MKKRNEKLTAVKDFGDITAEDFEQRTGQTPAEAATMLGLAYVRYMEFKRGVRQLKPYHKSSMLAHVALAELGYEV